jgi:hypothetical protein
MIGGCGFPRSQGHLQEGNQRRPVSFFGLELVSRQFGHDYPKLTDRAEELPPYREQPWIIDRGGYRKIDPNMMLVPTSRL